MSDDDGDGEFTLEAGDGNSPPPATSRGSRRGTRQTPAAASTSSKSAARAGRAASGLSASTSSSAPKLKLKIGHGEGTAAAAAMMSSTGPSYFSRKLDRDLDSDPDEPLLIEEQFILRMPTDDKHHGTSSDLAKAIHNMIAGRTLGSDKASAASNEPWFRMRDARRAVFGLGAKDKPQQSRTWNAKLVDLPCIIESHKTLDGGKHLFKVADVNQMLLVEDERPPGVGFATVDAQGRPLSGHPDDRFDIEDYIYPHGITPPLRHVRKRRFRKRANKRVRLSLRSLFHYLLTCV